MSQLDGVHHSDLQQPLKDFLRSSVVIPGTAVITNLIMLPRLIMVHRL
jgi:hypothetical protein